jgi:purine-binding chemotaxis protein CheW
MFQTPDYVSAVEEAADEGSLLQMVMLGAGDHIFGFPVDSVREIIQPRPFTPLPGMGEHVCGLINLRGRIVTVIDLGARLRLRPAAAREDHSIAIVDHHGKLVGIVVEEVSRIIDVDPGGLDDSAEALRALRLDRSYVRGLGEVGERVFVAIDPDELLRPVMV